MQSNNFHRHRMAVYCTQLSLKPASLSVIPKYVESKVSQANLIIKRMLMSCEPVLSVNRS